MGALFRMATPRKAVSSKVIAGRSSCPVACALDLLGDRWTMIVIRDLFKGKKRYADFQASPESIPTNILAERLKRLEQAGLISRTPYQNNPPRFDYALTENGLALRPVLASLAEWGKLIAPAASATKTQHTA